MSLDERLGRFMGEHGEQGEERKEIAACFDREPRSMSVVPQARHGTAELGVPAQVSTWH